MYDFPRSHLNAPSKQKTSTEKEDTKKELGFREEQWEGD